eukprot:15469865-Alexandrium_andersonii.AAC.1
MARLSSPQPRPQAMSPLRPGQRGRAKGRAKGRARARGPGSRGPWTPISSIAHTFSARGLQQPFSGISATRCVSLMRSSWIGFAAFRYWRLPD